MALPVNLNLEFNDPQSEFDFVYDENFYLSGQFKKSYEIINTQSFVSVDISNFSDTLEKIIVIPRDEFVPESTTTIRFTIDGDPLANYNIDFPCKKIFMWTVHQDFASKLLNMYVKTDSLTKIKIDVILISTKLDDVIE